MEHKKCAGRCGRTLAITADNFKYVERKNRSPYFTAKCRDCLKADRNDYYADYSNRPGNRERINEQTRARSKTPKYKARMHEYYRSDHGKAKHKEYRAKYRQDARYLEHEAEYRAEYNQRPEVKARKAEYNRNKRKNDPIYALRCKISGMILRSCKKIGLKNIGNKIDILGCSREHLLKHLTKDGELSFKGMHIDHIVPLRLYKICDDPFKAIIALNHWTNLRLIPELDNKRKNGKVPKITEIPVNIDRRVLDIYYKACGE